MVASCRVSSRRRWSGDADRAEQLTFQPAGVRVISICSRWRVTAGAWPSGVTVTSTATSTRATPGVLVQLRDGRVRDRRDRGAPRLLHELRVLVAVLLELRQHRPVDDCCHRSSPAAALPVVQRVEVDRGLAGVDEDGVAVARQRQRPAGRASTHSAPSSGGRERREHHGDRPAPRRSARCPPVRPAVSPTVLRASQDRRALRCVSRACEAVLRASDAGSGPAASSVVAVIGTSGSGQQDLGERARAGAARSRVGGRWRCAAVAVGAPGRRCARGRIAVAAAGLRARSAPRARRSGCLSGSAQCACAFTGVSATSLPARRGVAS